MTRYPTLIAALLLTLFGVLGTSLVAVTHEQTKERILANERQALLRSLQALVPAAQVDNNMTDDSILVHDPELLGSPETRVYRGRKDGEPVAAVFTTVAPNGYSGPIRLLVGIHRDGTLAGVRVVAHKETPGLGDKIDERKSDWVLAFTGLSLGEPPPERWKVRRDGGDFDQFTGATITPRAVVKAVRRTLEYAQREGAELYAPAPATDGA